MGLPSVVMLTPGFYPSVGGAEKQALELSKALAARGARVLVLTRRAKGLPASGEAAGIPVRRTAAWGPGPLNALTFLCSSLFFLLRHAREYDVIHVHLAGSPAVAAALAGRLLGKAVVVKIGGGRGIGEIALSARTVLGRLKLALLKRLKPRLAAVTPDLLEELREHGLKDRARVVPNGVDCARYRPAGPGDRLSVRAGLGWPDGPCFLYTGRLAPEKRLDLFLEAFARAAAGTAAFCVLAGAGPEEDALRRAAGRLGLAERVLFLPAVESVERLYAAADVFVLPSISEGLSNALLEAMASGLAVLASRVGGTAEAVADGVSGLLFPADRPGEMEGLIRRLLAEPGLAARLGRVARETAVRRYSLESAADRYLELYGARP